MGKMLKRVEPDIAFQNTFLRAVADYAAHDPGNFSFYAGSQTNFADYITKLRHESLGVNLRDGYVPQTTYWFLNDLGDIAGISRLRHWLSPALEIVGGHIGYDVPPAMRGRGYATEVLRQTLTCAKAMGLERVLLTADIENVASTRVIEKNGGVLYSTNVDPKTQEPQGLYWIDLTL